jgi:peptidyl-prolyl cis-trans isomerase C
MSKTLMKLSAAAFALCVAMPAHAQEDVTADTVVATVNGVEITLGHVLSVREGLPEQYQQLPNDVLWSGIIEQLIQQELIGQKDTTRETRRIRIALENERRALLAQQGLATLLTEEAIQAAYEAKYLQAAEEKEFNASHILVDTEEEAIAIVSELAGGADFASLARAKSTGPSGPNGGELGWFGAGMMVPEFQSAVEGLAVGAVSVPVKTQFGWHVIKLNETRIKEAPTLETVRAELANTVQQDAIAAELDRLMSQSEVTQMSIDDIDTSILSNFELLED